MTESENASEVELKQEIERLRGFLREAERTIYGLQNKPRKELRCKQLQEHFGAALPAWVPWQAHIRGLKVSIYYRAEAIELNLSSDTKWAVGYIWPVSNSPEDVLDAFISANHEEGWRRVFHAFDTGECRGLIQVFDENSPAGLYERPREGNQNETPVSDPNRPDVFRF